MFRQRRKRRDLREVARQGNTNDNLVSETARALTPYPLGRDPQNSI